MRHSADVGMKWPEIGNSTQFISGTFPLPTRPSPDAAVISTNLVFTHTYEVKTAIIRGMTRYKFAIIDVDRFCDLKNDTPDPSPVLDLFEEFGFNRPEPFLNLGTVGRFYIARPRVA